MKYTINEFAQEIRKLYPGDYDDLSNDELVKLWLKKFPQDTEKIDFTNNGQKNHDIDNKVLKNNVKSNGQTQSLKTFKRVLVASVFIAIVCIGVMYSLNSGSIGENYSEFAFTGSDSSNPFDEITINESISGQVDNSEFIKSLGLSGEEIIKIKKILSDTNPDPELKSGTNSGQTQHKCKWCGDSYFVDSYYQTLQDYLLELMNFDALAAGMNNLQKIFGVNESSKIRQYISSYERGDKYASVSAGDNNGFCSQKCKNEDRYSRN